MIRQLLIPIGCVVLGIVLIGCETFLPTAGILGVLAAISVLSGIAMSFYYGGIVTGTTFLVVTVTVVAGVVVKLVRWWPHTTIGKRILIEPTNEEILVDRSDLQLLVGRVGQTQGLMMPGGYVEIDGKRHDAVAEVAIEAGEWVTVTGLSGGRTLKVRPIDKAQALQSLQDAAGESDPLTRPAGDVLDDPFEDALG